MKYAIIIPDGFADYAIDSLQGKTPMQAARTPNWDKLVRQSIVGRSFNVPASLTPGSDVATLSLLGYDPLAYYTGRAPLEAVAQGIETGPLDWTFRCNLVCIEDGIMKSFTADHISSEEAQEIIESLNREISPLWSSIAPEIKGEIEFYAGVSYRNLMIFRPETARDAELFSLTTRTFPPHDYTDQKIDPALPQGTGSDVLMKLMDKITEFLVHHPVNEKRRAAGRLPASWAWLWGQGKKPDLQPFTQRFGIRKGAMITAVDLLRGIARLLQWDCIDVPGITGYVDTDYAAKGRYAVQALNDYDIVCVHVEATDEAGHEGSVEKKIVALEQIDELILAPILEKLRSFPEWRLLTLPDHPTPVSKKTHTRECIPWLIAGSDVAGEGFESFDEVSAAGSPHCFTAGVDLMPFFLGKQK